MSVTTGVGRARSWGWAGLLACGGVIALLAGYSIGEEKKAVNQRVYELRTYTTHDGRLEALHKRFRDHTIKLFEKHGMKNGMYWVPTDEKLSKNTLIYVVSHESAEAAKKSWEAFRNDPDWKKVREESEKDGAIVAKVDSVYMTLVDYSPVK
ncbi:MAG: NIPSNAP family protein [Planctomycetota bacterium]